MVRKWQTVAAEMLRVASEAARQLEARMWSENGMAVQISPSLGRMYLADGSPLEPAMRARLLAAR